MKKSKKILALTGAVALMASGSAHSATTAALGDYFQSILGLLPNKTNISVYEETSYNDNISNDPKHRRETVIFDQGISLDIYRSIGNVTYGVNGTAGFEYYTRRSHDYNQTTWNLAPFIMGDILGLQYRDFKISLHSKAEYEPLSASDTRRARSYKNGVSFVYDYSRNERRGFTIDGDYNYDYYPQKEFRGYSKQSYGIGLTPYYRLTEKIRLGVRTNYTRTEYRYNDLHDDSDELTINGMVDYVINQFFIVYGEAGTTKRFYEGESKDMNGDREWMPDFRLGVRYVPTKHWSFHLNTKLAPDDTNTAFRGDSLDCTTVFTAVWSPVAKLALTSEIGLKTDDEKSNDRDTREFYCSARADYHFTSKLSVYTQYKYNNVQFTYDSDEDYRINEVLAGISYRF